MLVFWGLHYSIILKWMTFSPSVFSKTFFASRPNKLECCPLILRMYTGRFIMILFDTDYLNQLYYSCWYLKKMLWCDCDLIRIRSRSLWPILRYCDKYTTSYILVTHKCNQKHENFIQLSENCKCYISIGNSTKKKKRFVF